MHNNPVNAIDPSGMMWSIPQITVGIALGALVFGVIFGIGYAINNKISNYLLVKGSTPIMPVTNADRAVEMALSFLSNAVGIPGSGVTQAEVDGLRDMLNNGRIYEWANPSHEGLTAFNNIYLDISGDITSGSMYNNLPEEDNIAWKTDYTIANYPDGDYFGYIYGLATTMYHEYQHILGAKGEPLESRFFWDKTYGKEATMANSVINHLNSLPSQDVLYLSQKENEIDIYLRAAMLQRP